MNVTYGTVAYQSAQPFATIFIGFRCDSVRLLFYKCLQQLAAPYLVSMISPVRWRQSLDSLHVAICSADQGGMVVARTKTAWFRPKKLFSRWSVSVGQSAAGNEDDITDTRRVLRQAENWNVSSQLLRNSAAVVIFIIRLRKTLNWTYWLAPKPVVIAHNLTISQCCQWKIIRHVSRT